MPHLRHGHSSPSSTGSGPVELTVLVQSPVDRHWWDGPVNHANPTQPMSTRPSAHAFAHSSSSSQVQHNTQIHQLHPLFARLAFHIVTAKIEDVGRVYQCVDELGGQNVSLDEARFVVTALQGRPRLLKALGSDVLVSQLRPRVARFPC